MSSEKEILALEDKRFAAMIGGDWKTVQGLAHDQLLSTHSSAITDTKATWLESMTSGKTKYKSASFTDRKVRMIGDAARYAAYLIPSSPSFPRSSGFIIEGRWRRCERDAPGAVGRCGRGRAAAQSTQA